MASIFPKKSLKSRLQEGENLYDLFLLPFSTVNTEIAAHAGYDFIVLDLEHGSADIQEVLNCIHAIEAVGCLAVLRVPDISQAWTKKVLDLAPNGKLFRKVETARSACEVVLYCRYRSVCVRRCAYTVVRDSKYEFDKEYLANYADKLLIMSHV